MTEALELPDLTTTEGLAVASDMLMEQGWPLSGCLSSESEAALRVLWACCRQAVLHELACRYAERALPIWEQMCPGDDTPARAIEAQQQWSHAVEASDDLEAALERVEAARSEVEAAIERAYEGEHAETSRELRARWEAANWSATAAHDLLGLRGARGCDRASGWAVRALATPQAIEAIRQYPSLFQSWSGALRDPCEARFNTVLHECSLVMRDEQLALTIAYMLEVGPA